MRTLPPSPPDREPPLQGAIKRELLFRWIIPLPFWGSVYFLGLLMGREMPEAPHKSLGDSQGRLLSLVLLALLLFIFMAGIFFTLYLIKSLLGFDLFPDGHLME